MGVMCQILLKKPKEGIYRPGQPVVGTIKYGFDKPAELKDIVLSFIGEGKCEWSESHSSTNSDGSSSTSTTWYKGKEDYASQHIHLLPQSKKTVTLNVGMYEYPFQFIIPENIPSSYKDTYCCISYKIIVRFIKASIFSFTKQFESEIVVYGYANPITPDGPVIFGLRKTLFKPFSAKEEVIDLKAEIANTLLMPGQNADIKIIVRNDANITIPSIRTKLFCKSVYTANCGKTNTVTTNFNGTTVDTVSIPKNSVANLSTTVPILPQLYSIQNSRIIRKDYKVYVTVRLPMPHIDASVEMPVVIGERYNNHEIEIDFLEDDPPPSYWEAMNEVAITEKK